MCYVNVYNIKNNAIKLPALGFLTSRSKARAESSIMACWQANICWSIVL